MRVRRRGRVVVVFVVACPVVGQGRVGAVVVVAAGIARSGGVEGVVCAVFVVVVVVVAFAVRFAASTLCRRKLGPQLRGY